MKLDVIVRLNELFDMYGELLTDYQKEVLSEYLEYDLSFAEIAENRKVSRQSSFIVLNKSIKKLEEYEEKIGAVKAKREYQKVIKAVLEHLKNGEVEQSIDILSREA